MSSKNIKWLYSELPELVEKSVISSETAERLKEYYGEPEEFNPVKIAFIICAILGALLVGLGIILIIAHNWEELGKFSRTILSFLPLVISQLLTAWVIFKKFNSTAWKESVSTILLLSIGASISLISQTYHISGDFAGFILTWLLLGIPVVILLNVTTPCLIYLYGITHWTFYADHPVYYWLLLVLIAPHLIYALREGLDSVRSQLLIWFSALSLVVCTETASGFLYESCWLISYSLIFSIMYLLGKRYFDSFSFIKNPLMIIANTGIVAISLIATYEEVWRDVGDRVRKYEYEAFRVDLAFDILILTVLTFAFVYLFVKLCGLLSLSEIPFPSVVIVAMLMFGYSYFLNDSIIPMLVFNLYIFTVGILNIFVGVKSLKSTTLNWGMSIIVIHILLRFFDSDISLLAKGLIFTVLGIMFLTANYIILKRKRALDE